MPVETPSRLQDRQSRLSRRRMVTFGCLVIAAALVSAALGAPALAKPTKDSGAANFAIGIPADPENLDPAGTYTEAADQVWRHAYSGLVTYRTVPSKTARGSFELDRRTVVPDLAEGWDISSGGRVYTFQLRAGLKWPTGDPISVDDVIYSYERAIGLKGVQQFFLSVAGITDVAKQFTKVNESTLQLALPRANPRTLRILALGATRIVNSALVKSRATTDDPWAANWVRANYAGYGRYVVSAWDPGARLILTPNPGWYGKKPTGSLTFQIVPNEASRLLLLQRGALDAAQGISAVAVRRAQEDQNVSILPFKTGAVDYIALDTRKKPFSDLRVRQALAYALDVNRIIREAWFNAASRATSPIPPGYEGHSPSWQYRYDPDRARSLLSEAGYGKGFTMELIFFDRSKAEAVAIQSQLGAVGVKVKLRQLTQGQYVSAYYGKKNYQAALQSCWTFIDETYYTANLMLHSAGLCTPHYANKRIDRLVDSTKYPASPSVAAGAAREAQRLFAADAGYTLLVQPDFRAVVRKGLSGLVFLKEDFALGFWELKRA